MILTPRKVIEGRAITTHARVSPDGGWVAYASAESGRFEIVIQDSHDGRRLLVNTAEVVATPVTVVYDWPALIRNRR